MPNFNSYKTSSLKTKFGLLTVYTQSMKIRDVMAIHYVAIRGKDEEEGAVQRVLNKQRIASIKKYILEGNDFYSSFILNWTNKEFEPKFSDNQIEITIVPSSAQVIDGQHRLVGLLEAIKEDSSLGEKEILVTICIGLTTKEAARIFININTEQKPVAKSLIYDLFGEIEDNIDFGINRATEIAQELNTNPDSPYYKNIKFPGQPRGVGMVDLSTVVDSLKKHLEIDGSFFTHNLSSLDYQKQVILNYLKAIKHFYDKEDLWFRKTQNPFLLNSGFHAAIEHLVKNLLYRCAEKKSFKVPDFINLLDLQRGDLIVRDAIKNLEGKSQRKQILEFLEKNLFKSLPNAEEYEF